MTTNEPIVLTADSPDGIELLTFRTTRWSTGYNMDDVDTALDAIQQAWQASITTPLLAAAPVVDEPEWAANDPGKATSLLALAQRTHDDIIDAAETDAAKIRGDALNDKAKAQAAIDRALEEAEQQRLNLLAEAREQAKQVVQQAQVEAFDVQTRAHNARQQLDELRRLVGSA